MKRYRLAHTPGPWRATAWGQTISIDRVAKRGTRLGLAHINPNGVHNGGIPSRTDCANGRLMAEAPDLLKALDLAEAFLEDGAPLTALDVIKDALNRVHRGAGR